MTNGGRDKHKGEGGVGKDDQRAESPGDCFSSDATSGESNVRVRGLFAHLIFSGGDEK